MKKIQGGAIYASTSFITDYVKDKSLPKIHDTMGQVMDLIPVSERKGAIDLGACHGMLSLRARAMGWFPVFGLEADLPSVELHRLFIKEPGVTLMHSKLDVRSKAFRDTVISLMGSFEITTIFARRVFPEILSNTFGKDGLKAGVIRDAAERFTDTVISGGIKYLVVEGRQFRSNTTHPLGNIDLEIEVLGPRWKVMSRINDAVLMVPVA